MTVSDISSDRIDRTQPPIPEAPLESGVPESPIGGTTSAPAIPRRFTALDGLRGLAAIVVVVFHLRREFRDIGIPDSLDRLITGGYLMVDLFFVLSGFVMARTMLRTRHREDFLRFAELRVRRFMPLHLTGWAIALLGVTVLALCQQFGIFHTPERGAFHHADSNLRAWASSLVLVQGILGPQFSGYAAAWSLSVELWVNILIVAVVAFMPTAYYRRLVGPSAFLAGMVVLAWTLPSTENSVGTVAFGRGLAGLGAGMVTYELYLLFMRRRTIASPETGATQSVRWAAPVGVISLLLLVLACWERGFVREFRFLPMMLLAPVLVVSLALPSGGPAKWLLNTPVVQWLGSRSFAIYALHGPVLMSVKLVLELRGLNPEAPKVAAVIIVVGMIGAISLAEIGHRYIETAWQPKKKPKPAPEPVVREPVSV
ncbi:acyltransferase [Kineosporia sp. NBRC 101731]|uniref:acyltransferase family protein n=1 Tax=Kineosporia sp. NBRC 101731 TaxID=3032199 RepID=UPI0024A607BD|nr:acyltransferase [Kineosporia sp. NBRC 101731]GLY30052.1 hypothetical protein Kisp02_34170 [Kineosporia sp. NBRC 101731]